MYKSSCYCFYIISLVLFFTQVANATFNLPTTVPTPCSSTTKASICAGTSYLFNGINYSNAGTYTVHLTTATGGDSTAILNLYVNQLPTPTVTASGATTFCAGDSVTLTVNTQGDYLWNTGGKSQAITVYSSGYYRVYFTDANGCSAFSPETTVTVNPLPTISTGAIADVCSQSKSVLLPYSATTGNPDQYSITWSQATLGAGMSNIGWTSLGASPIIINNPPWPSTTYNGAIRVRNSTTGCVSSPGTTSVTKICGIAGESGYLTLTAPAGGLISEIVFASYGTPSGSCGNFAINPTCHASNSDSVPKARCLGQNGCAFSAANYYFGDPCPGTVKYMYVQANATTLNPQNPISFYVKHESVSNTNITICSGSSYTFNGTNYYNAGTYYVYLTNTVGCDSIAVLNLTVNASSSSTTNATICSGSTYIFNGNMYSNSGTYVVHLTNSIGCDSAATLVLTVNPSPSVAAINGLKAVCVGNAVTLKDATLNGVWSSTNNSIATVAINGAVTGVASGTANILYTVSNSNGCSASASVSIVVNATPILDTIVGNKMVCVGANSSLTNSTLGGTWSSFDYYVGTITQQGIFTGNAYGTTLVSYSFTNANGCTSKVSTILTVNNNPYVGLISGSNIVCTGNVDTLRPGASFGTWSSSNNISATISSNGYVSGLVAGKDTISYTLTNTYGCTSVAKTVITVIDNPLILDTIVGDNNVCVSSTVKLTNSTTNGSWSSFNNYVGSISSEGLFTGNAYGTTLVTYFVANNTGCTAKATKTFSVFNKPYIGTLTGANIVCSGNTITLKSSVGGGAWLSTNNSIASVSNKGIVTGITGGNDTISYSLVNSNGCVSTLIQPVRVASTASNTTASICPGSSYLFNGTNYSNAGTYTAHLTNSAGCDSVVTLVLSINPLPLVASIIGSNSICAGNQTVLIDSTIGGSWSSSNQSIATVDSFGNVAGISDGSVTISYSITSGCGLIKSTKIIQVSSSKPVVQPITGTSIACLGNNSTLSDATVGGIWTSDNDSIASVNDSTGVVSAIADGTVNITYTVSSAFGCNAFKSVPFTVSCSSVTSGGDGGLESKSMGNAVAKRVYNKALANTINTVNYYTQPIVKEGGSRLGNMGIVTPGSQSVTTLMPSLSAIGAGFTAYDMSAGVADLPGMTNASIVKAYDYVVNSQTIASTLISRTYGLVYQHTKPICDRLKEATLLDVKQVTVHGLNFIQYKLLQNTGQTEYAISFSAGIQQGVDSFKIQSVWLTQNFMSQDTMFNFQIWSIDPTMTVNMLKSALNKLANELPLTQVNLNLGVPSTYISKITRNQNQLLLTINNNSASTNGYLNLLVNPNENSTNQESITQPISLLPNASTDISVDLKDNYECDVHLFVDSVQKDLAYMNDGNWNFNISNTAILPNAFNIINDGVMPSDSTEFRLLRNVQINVNVPDYVSIYKMLMAGGLAKDLSAFNNLEFKAVATGAGQIRIVIQKSSISNWNDQYSYTLPISNNMNGYKVKLSDFTSTSSKLPLNANDIITVTFSFISDGGNNINATIADAKFTKTNTILTPVVVDSFSAKSVSVYPNPVKDRFVCSFQSDKKTMLTLKIVELSSGKVVVTNQVLAVVGNNSIPIIVNSFKVKYGAYILILEGEETKYQPFKILFN